jgi:hypothetical protein
MAGVATLMFLAVLVGLGSAGARALAGLFRGDYLTIDIRGSHQDR